ncbi:unnamed protein product [Vitrella brassicaformis CCMP3155]|uniref:Uncharacterized protein n=1 Tax=Vitrella brassicaformis (strain CCMP3155) TaxID=1169540 RepID=A0A0G4G710_VITBC|nr:unnamed protein product [Vitrella brassicaformis CCMP3155]|mmetsp:Transcript_30459/g.75614  ORF Transcript_30459/g.75614 Transcript_30459/m.75614 type:complete len:187 (-) Transcript_30459:1251-1811(-)|eukprot:CEM24405.1 unnamed protein product [Vitrella brassicaformis CCMP3155]
MHKSCVLLGSAVPHPHYGAYGSTLQKIFSFAAFNRLIAFSLGWGFTFAFWAPDESKIYDVFPVFKQKHYAYLVAYKVPREEFGTFEFHWRSLARFCQMQEGYLYTRLLKARKYDKADAHYISLTTWVTERSHSKAMAKTKGLELQGKLPTGDRFKSQLYKIVVDDSEYSPVPDYSPTAGPTPGRVA